MSKPLTIGAVSKRLNVPVETIRYYEREGLLLEPVRTASNYRVYAPNDVDRLAFILNCRALDMAHDEIRALLEFRDQPRADCGDVNMLVEEHIEHVATRIAELQQLERNLRSLRRLCKKEMRAADCGILDGLEKSGRQGAKKGGRRHVRGAH